MGLLFGVAEPIVRLEVWSCFLLSVASLWWKSESWNVSTGANWPQGTGSNFDLGGYSWNMVRSPPKGKLEPVLQRERNCNYYDRSSIAEKEKLQLLRPLQYCKQQKTAITTTAPPLQREGNCNYHDRSNVAERETAITTTAPVLQRRKL